MPFLAGCISVSPALPRGGNRGGKQPARGLRSAGETCLQGSCISPVLSLGGGCHSRAASWDKEGLVAPHALAPVLTANSSVTAPELSCRLRTDGTGCCTWCPPTAASAGLDACAPSAPGGSVFYGLQNRGALQALDNGLPGNETETATGGIS